MTEITQETQDKFRAAIIDKIRQHFPDTDIRSPAIIEEKHFAIVPSLEVKTGVGFSPIVYGGIGDSVDAAIQEALEDINKIRFMKRPDLVYIRSADVFGREDFASNSVVFGAKTRIVFMYGEDKQ